jgi:hypothetical protein
MVIDISFIDGASCPMCSSGHYPSLDQGISSVQATCRQTYLALTV